MKLSLYYSPWCPFCIKVTQFLKRVSVDVELRDITKKEHFRALKKGGGKTQVPCLKIEKNQTENWMYESNDIIQFLTSV